ncbi:class I SAM-dependent methyltransferase [Nonomuraea longicatena]|uniref:Class I SAM-dependent methyltransferase n=1 Tax=Nonomuraea longicatena TaxID=83682 RepID=Q27IF7_9ACTN|nr:InkM [Nonomuraea longicatena]ACN29716.1 probable sugar O-methyltransferase [Nonomuraea longicatena]
MTVTSASVVAVAALPEHEAHAAVAALGPAEVAEIVLAEVAALTGVLPGPEEKVPVQFDLGFGGGRLAYTLTVGGGAASVAAGPLAEPDVVIRQELTELLRSVYGEAGVHDATREIFLNAPDGPPGSDPTGRLARRRAAAVAAARSASLAATQNPVDLTELAIRTGTDKWGRHWYTGHYQQHFRRFRDSRVRVLEIGCDGGESMRMWTHYFRRGEVIRMDAKDKALTAPQRARSVFGAQDDLDFLARVAAEHGPFDLVIDDGSHVNDHVLTSFRILFPHLRAGGLYVIEDLGASYWPGWGGSSTELSTPATTVGFVKELIDGLNHQQLVRDVEHDPSLTDRTVSGISLHHNIAFVHKGRNTERGAPAWVTRAESALFL